MTAGDQLPDEFAATSAQALPLPLPKVGFVPEGT